LLPQPGLLSLASSWHLTYDKEKYRKFLLDAAETVLGYFGFDADVYRKSGNEAIRNNKQKNGEKKEEKMLKLKETIIKI